MCLCCCPEQGVGVGVSLRPQPHGDTHVLGHVHAHGGRPAEADTPDTASPWVPLPGVTAVCTNHGTGYRPGYTGHRAHGHWAFRKCRSQAWEQPTWLPGGEGEREKLLKLGRR